MDTFLMQRMSFDGAAFTTDPPLSEKTGFLIEDPRAEKGTYDFNLSTDGIIEPWLEQEADRYT